jgi:SpoVK/Ycf46/Vps4 family AAA+-type ATPase
MRKLKLEVADAGEVASHVAQHLPLLVTGADISTVASSAVMKATERLCLQVDMEVLRRQDETGFEVTVDEVLADWDGEQLEVVVKISDLISAAKNVEPSVSLEDMDRYRRLQERYETGSSPSKV